MTENELIAIFLGWTKCECADKKTHYKHGEKNYEVAHVNEMQFDKQWDWIMMAVDKIENLEKIRARVIIEGRLHLKEGCYVITGRCKIIAGTMRVEVHRSTKIKSVYDAVIQFIKIYNEKD